MRDFSQEVNQFCDQDYVVVQDILTDEDLRPVKDDLCAFIDHKAEALITQGKITDACTGLDFEYRIVGLFQQCPSILGGMDIMLMRTRGLFDFLHNEHLLDLVEALLGSEITCNPIQHLRAKMPARVESTSGFLNVPWHQDAGVTLEEADPTEIITFWIPMIDATIETGCMQLIPGCRKIGLKGGVVVMNKCTPHRGQPNLSDMARWTIDLRFQKTGEPTGRPFHPDFVVRSRHDPASVKRDYEAWCDAWEYALANSAGKQAHRLRPPS
jgi:hypothetical protein